MHIWVCSLARAEEMVSFHKPERVLSLLSSEDEFPQLEGYTDETHLKLQVDDIGGIVTSGEIEPAEIHAGAVIDFAKSWPRNRSMLIHCLAGVSRSSAAAYIALCALNPLSEPEDIAGEIRRNSITALPNPNLVAHADRLLNRRGRMVSAVRLITESWEFHLGHDVMPYRLDASFPDKGGFV